MIQIYYHSSYHFLLHQSYKIIFQYIKLRAFAPPLVHIVSVSCRSFLTNWDHTDVVSRYVVVLTENQMETNMENNMEACIQLAAGVHLVFEALAEIRARKQWSRSSLTEPSALD